MVYYRGWSRKYEAAWEREDTKAWKIDASKQLANRCLTTDYTEYAKTQESLIELNICQNIFHTTEEDARRAFEANNELLAYNNDQRDIAKQIRLQIVNAAKSDQIKLQPVPMILRLDEHIKKSGIVLEKRRERDAQKKKNDDAESPEEDKLHESIPYTVFRVKTPDGLVFVDNYARIYDSWSDFLSNNKIPKSMICRTEDGYLGGEEDVNNNDVEKLAKKTYNDAQMVFEESASCGKNAEAKGALDTVVAVVAPIATVALFWTPAGSIGTILSVASKTTLSYGMLRTSMEVMDKGTHGQHVYNECLQLLTQFGTLALSYYVMPKLSKNFRKTAIIENEIPQLQKFFLYAINGGMSVMTATSLVGMIYAVATKKEVTALDFINLLASIHNMCSVVMSLRSVKKLVASVREELRTRPISAKQHYTQMERFRQQQERIDTKMRTLERERNSLNESGQNPERVLEIETELSKMKEQVEHCRQQIEHHMDMHHAYSDYHLEQATLAKQKTENLVQEKKELLAKQEQLRQEGKTAEADRMNNDIAKLDKDIREGKAETEKHREKFHDNQKKTMENAETKALYDRFRSEARRGEAKTYVDNDGRVIQAVLEMDAKQVFEYLATNKATVCFSNGETLDLLIDEQLPLHPRTIKQFYKGQTDPVGFLVFLITAQISPNTISKSSDFAKILELTKDFKAKKIESSEFRMKVNRILQQHQMCTLEEVNAWKEDIDTVFIDSPADRRLFENLTPAEAFRLKTVMEKPEFNNEPHDNFKIAKVVAGVRLAKDLNLHGNIVGIADCIEVIANYAVVKADNLKSQWKAVENDTGLNPEQKGREFGRLRTEYGITDGTWKYTNNNARVWKMEYTRGLGQINSISDYESMITELRRDMQDVKNFCRHAPHQFKNLLSATYHFRKHLSEALKQHYGEEEIPKNLTREKKLEIYFKIVPKILFAADNQFSFSQNGLTIVSKWNLDTGYFGVKSQPYVPYTKHFRKKAGIVKTHFNPKK